MTKAGNFGPYRKDTPVLWDWGAHDLSILISLIGQSPNKISTKRINFLLDTLKELALKRNLLVFLGDPKLILSDYNYAVTFACVPKYQEITKIIKPVAEYPTVRLADPISFYPRSYTSWKKKIKLTV